MDKLSEFVSEQLKAGVNTSEMRDHLIRNGWKTDEVDYAIKSAVGKRNRTRILYVAIAVVILGGLMLSLFSIAKNLNHQTELTPPKNNNLGEELQTDIPSVQGCSDKESSMEKDDCYKQLLKAGFKCSTLTEEIENVYCNRAFEESMLKGVEVVEEN